MDQEIIKAVRDHAKAHYNEGGWDVLVECWEDADITRAAGSATTAQEAIVSVGRILEIHDEVRTEIQNEAF